MMYCLCYVSTKRKGLLQSDIMDIIESSSKKNLNKDITGILIDYQNNFLQHLEGDPILIYELFEKIKQDPRHEKISLVQYSPIEKRLFTKWNMIYKNVDASINNQKELNRLKQSLNELIEHKSFWNGIKTIEAMSNLIQD